MSSSTTATADWMSAAVAELVAGQNDDGGWPYGSGVASSTEATSLAMLAIAAVGGDVAALAPALAWLTVRQRTDGAFTVSAECPDASWVTPLAAIVLARHGRTDAVQLAAEQLLAAEVFVLDPTPTDLYGYDTTIPGWPWTSGDYSFAEPTSLAAVFLKQQGYAQHERVRQAMAALRTRALADGGWNYGEPVVLNGQLYPAAPPTALVLLAMADEQDATTAAGVEWLSGQAGTLSSLFSLGWAAVGMNVLGRLDDVWTAEVIARWQATPIMRRNSMDTALCILGVVQTADHPFAVENR